MWKSSLIQICSRFNGGLVMNEIVVVPDEEHNCWMSVNGKKRIPEVRNKEEPFRLLNMCCDND
jgi:hypothetical protein